MINSTSPFFQIINRIAGTLKKKIVLVTNKQPSSNPRLVKEATTLAAKGYAVSVVYNHWSRWADTTDKIILEANPGIEWIKTGSNPLQNKVAYWFIRLRHKCYRVLANSFPRKKRLQVLATSQFYPELEKRTCSIKADLYIAHNLGALPAAAKAAAINNSRYAFDAEDFHRQQETGNHKEAYSTALIEDHYFNQASFITAGSPLIAAEYKKNYPALEFTTINNVFSKQQQPAFTELNTTPLKLFWFSQTLGLKRGLQDIIKAVNTITSFIIELTIVGDDLNGVKDTIRSQLTNAAHKLIFLPPCSEETLINTAAQNHIGLALEPGFSINNNIALSNKLFTYLLAGNAVIMSATAAQQLFYDQYPQVGWCYQPGDTAALKRILTEAYTNTALLAAKRRNAWELAGTTLNWENEQGKFLSLVNLAL